MPPKNDCPLDRTCTVVYQCNRYAARIPSTSSRTFASGSRQSSAWQKYTPVGAFLATVAGISTYCVVNAEAASTVIEINSPDASSIKITVSDSSSKKKTDKKAKKPDKKEKKKKVKKKNKKSLEDIELIVCDMAGTTVMEGGVVYKTLRESMNADGLNVSEEDMHEWHGAKKEAVIAHFAEVQGSTSEGDISSRVKRVSQLFESRIHDAYFTETAQVRRRGMTCLKYYNLIGQEQ